MELVIVYFSLRGRYWRHRWCCQLNRWSFLLAFGNVCYDWEIQDDATDILYILKKFENESESEKNALPGLLKFDYRPANKIK